MGAVETSTTIYEFSIEPPMTALRVQHSERRSRLLARQGRPPSSTYSMALAEPGDNVTTARNTTAPAETSLTLADQAMTQLIRFEQLALDWDGNGAAKPIKRSLEDARRFIRALAPESLIPRPALHADGHTVLLLNSGDTYAELEFLGENSIGFYARRGGQEWCDEFLLGVGTLPEGLSQIGLAIER